MVFRYFFFSEAELSRKVFLCWVVSFWIFSMFSLCYFVLRVPLYRSQGPAFFWKLKQSVEMIKQNIKLFSLLCFPFLHRIEVWRKINRIFKSGEGVEVWCMTLMFPEIIYLPWLNFLCLGHLHSWWGMLCSKSGFLHWKNLSNARFRYVGTRDTLSQRRPWTAREQSWNCQGETKFVWKCSPFKKSALMMWASWLFVGSTRSNQWI